MPRAFIPNKNFSKELQRESREYQAGLAAAAKPAADLAKTFAPVKTGSYRDGIRVTIDRDQVRIDAMDWKSGFIEFGTVDTPIFSPLRRGVRAAGLRLEEDRK